MNELKELYDKLISGLQEDHDRWVASNRKMRSIESARSQLGDVGDTPCSPALEVLNEAYQKERSWNEEATTKMYARKALIREIEAFAEEHGESWKGTYYIFGY